MLFPILQAGQRSGFLGAIKEDVVRGRTRSTWGHLLSLHLSEGVPTD